MNITAKVVHGRVVHTKDCSHPDEGTVWPGCSFCAEAQTAFDNFLSGKEENAEPGRSS